MPEQKTTRSEKRKANKALARAAELKQRRRRILVRVIPAAVAVAVVAGILLAVFFNPRYGVTSPRQPYSLILGRYESVYEAQQAIRRLSSLKLPVYLIRKVTADGDYSADVHLGGYKHARQAQGLAVRLQKRGLANTTIALYSEMAASIQRFAALPPAEQEPRALNALPETLIPSPVLKTLSLLPVNRDFRVQQLKIEDKACDLEEITGNKMFWFDADLLPPGVILEDVESPSELFCQVSYENILFGYRVNTTLVRLPGAEVVYKQLLEGLAPSTGTLIQANLTFSTSQGGFVGQVFQRTGSQVRPPVDNPTAGSLKVMETLSQFSYIACQPEQDYLLLLDTYDCPQGDFRGFLATGAPAEGLLSYPEVRNNLVSLPVKEEAARFANFSIDMIAPDFTIQRSNVPWAESVVGNYRSITKLALGKDVLVLSVINLNYPRTLDAVFGVFLDNKMRGDEGFGLEIRGRKGWYSSSADFTELSFPATTRVVALNYYPYFDETEVTVEDIFNLYRDNPRMHLQLMQSYGEKVLEGLGLES